MPQDDRDDPAPAEGEARGQSLRRAKNNAASKTECEDDLVRDRLSRIGYSVHSDTDWLDFASDMQFVRERRKARIVTIKRRTRFLLWIGGLLAVIGTGIIVPVISAWLKLPH